MVDVSTLYFTAFVREFASCFTIKYKSLNNVRRPNTAIFVVPPFRLVVFW